MKKIQSHNKDIGVTINKELGNTYTHPIISNEIVTLYCDSNKEYSNILEPSVGSGSFYYPLSELKHKTIDVYDIDENAISMINAKQNTTKTTSDFLTVPITKKYNLIATNPPYVSYNNIPADNKDEYINEIKSTINFNTLGIHKDEVLKKSDLYMYFYLKCLSLLEDDGELIFLCSDSWLNSSFGEVLKKVLRKNYQIEVIASSHFYSFFADETNAIIIKIR